MWFNLGDRDLAIGLRRAQRLAEGATLTEAIGRARRALGVGARVLPMADEPVRTRVLARGRWVRLPGVHDPRARRRARSTASSFAGVEAARAPEAVLDAIARRAGDRRSGRRTRSSRSARSSRSRACATRCAPPRRRWSPSRPSSAARCSRARPRRSWRGPACRSSAAGIARAYAACSTAWSADEPVERRARRCETDTLHGRRRRAGGAWRATSLRFAEAARRCGPARSCRSSASTTPSSAWTRRSTRAPAARWPRPWCTTCWTRCAASERIDTVVVVTRRARRRGAGPRATTPSRSDDDDARPLARRALRRRLGASSAAPSACCWCPATARRSTPREVDELRAPAR